MKRLGWHSMSLSRRVLLLLTLVLVSAAVQISIAQIQTISQFLHETEKCIGTLEEYHWEYGDPDALNEEVRSSMKAASDHLSSLKFRDGAVSENTLLLFHAVRTTYPFYVERLDEIRQALENNTSPRRAGFTMTPPRRAASTWRSTAGSCWSRPSSTAMTRFFP